MDKYAFSDDYKNPRGIPRVEYIADMPAFVKNGGGGNTVVSNLLLESSKYEHMEKRLKRLSEEKKEVRSYYCLTDSVFGEADVLPCETVHLWMGAKVMVEYTFDEARELLEKNLSNAEGILISTKEDLAFVQEQMTNLQINISRVYNYDLKNRPKKEEETK